MSAAVNRRRIVLGAALGATLAAALWLSQGEGTDNASEVAGMAAPVGPRLPARREAAPDAPSVQLGRPAQRAATDPTRDAFVSRSWVTPPPRVQEAPRLAPSAPPLPFTYMGKLQEGETGPVTVYLMLGEQAYSVKKGDVIDKTYRVESITDQQIVLTYLPMAIKQTLTFGTSSS